MENETTNMIEDAHGVRLARYVAGRASPAEHAEVRAWIAADPRRAELLESLREVWELIQRERPGQDVDAAWDEFRRRRDSRRDRQRRATTTSTTPKTPLARTTPATRTPRATRTTRATPRWRVPAWAIRVAAVLALVVAGTAVWTLVDRRLDSSPRAMNMREYATNPGQRAELRLSDGTRAVLSVQTRLRVPEDYGRQSRDIYLEGEAMFEVRHDERRPFRVHAQGVSAEDLGTVFGVRGYPDGTPVTVVVAEGVVEVTAKPALEPPATHRLNPRQLASVTADGRVRVVNDIDPAEYLGFADGRIVFKDTTLRDAAAELERWYDLDVRVADSALAGLPLTAVFEREPASRVLDLIALSLEVEYERDGNVVTFYR